MAGSHQKGFLRALQVAVCVASVQLSAGNDGVCYGFDEMWSSCPELPSCEECVPTDCTFGEWGEWYDSFAKCSGLRFRERSLSVVNNECGKPCDGPKIESVQHLTEGCVAHPVDCSLSDWSQWSACQADLGQVYRQRKVLAVPSDGGMPCSGGTEETRPCGEGPPPEACLFAPWQEWTSCSASCGGGRRTRMRRVASEAQHSGDTCQGSTLETAPCELQACGGVDCALAEWGDWSMCDPERHPQRYRRRDLLEAASGAGKRCNETLKETQGCPLPPEQHCELSAWSEWTAVGWREPKPPPCNKECGGGQAFRTRDLRAPPSHGGSCPANSLREMKACNTQPCNVPCQFSDWSHWSMCSAECGKGTMTRRRALANPDALFSEGCQGALEEALPCLGSKGSCPYADCQWGEWYAWSTCSASCGGGQKHRSRSIAAMPLGGGAACQALTKSEAAPCNSHLCEPCMDGLWGDWGEWEACSATCSSAFSLRRRSIAQEPNSCGRPVSGLKHEYRACSDLPPCEADRDCELSDWNEWSSCSASCFGVQERNRYIKVFQAGGGAHCDLSSLKETAACNPLTGEEAAAQCKPPGPTDCMLSFWEDWTSCSKSCGGGQRERRRKVLTLPKDGGKPCSGELTAVGPCSSQPCELEVCVDCQWGLWSEWGHCDSCKGHKYRHRSIEQMPNHCGKMCDLKSAKEVTNCTGQCDVALVCAWTEWSAPSGCSTGCGERTMMRSRALSLLPAVGRGRDAQLFPAADASSSCLGAQLNMSACPDMQPCEAPCVPLDCGFQAWGDWSEPGASGLCERRRTVASVNNKCGRPCEGAMGETKPCVLPNAERRDCLLSEWIGWGECKMNGKGGQQHRERSVLQQPAFGGLPCSGALQETQRCNVLEPLDCMLGPWSDWGDCEKSCGGGWHVRERRVLQDSAHGGRLCEDSLHEMRMCNVQECYEPQRDCSYGEWSAWSACGAHDQRYRERKVLSFAEGKGQACEGDLEETQACPEIAVDCVVSDWTTWDTCDKTCGGGQAQRHRQIMVFPEHGGSACPPDLAQTTGCSESPCDAADCQVSDWQEWSACSASCGPAHRERQRQLLQQAGPGGAGCSLELRELSPCASPACERQGCEWGEWEEWTTCPVSCGGGQQQRSREILKMPEEGGRLCEPRDKEQVRPCSEQLCAPAPCTDGLWSDWEEWSACSASCGGGVSFRLRKVAQMADSCGEPVTGDSRETRICKADVACEPPVDCLFSDWGLWSACSQSCSGVMTRSRSIQQYGSGGGSFCNGHLKETSPCNPSPLETTPAACAEAPPVDCVVSEWALWGDCSASCGGGQQTRSRTVLTPPANGGKACDGALSLARQCGSERCPGPAPVDCAFGAWQEWGACAKCDGQRTRFRHITQYPQHGGKACEPFEAEEASACPRACHEKQYCAWSDWAAWGECTAKCGEGKRMRRRYLGLTATPSAPPAPVEELLNMYSELRQQTGALGASHGQELLMAFAGGFLSFVVALLGAGALVRARRYQRGSEAAPRELQGLGPEVAGNYRNLRAGQASEPLVMDA